MVFSKKKKLCGLFIIILCVCIFIKLYIKINKDTNFYRLGDVVNGKTLDIKILKNNTLKKYPKSIGAAYIRMTNKSNDFVVLDTIVNSMCKDTSTSNILAVHLRLGDVLCQSSIKTKISEFINKGKYIVKSADYIANYLNKYFPDTHKIIYYGNHTGKCNKQTENFINEIREKTYNCKIVEPSSSYAIADQHLCEMINAKQFLMTGSSGYAKLIENIRKERGKESLKIV